MLYELAKHKNAQIRVIQEVDNYFKKNNGEIKFEAINEMPYLQACIAETLRFYPVLGVLTRTVFEDYTLPKGLRLEMGTSIHIPVHHIQRNPDYFSDPEEFRPEQFLPGEKENIKQFTYIPFGEGPRLCLGKRFSKMPMVAGYLTIIKNYHVEMCEKTQSAYKFEPRAIVTQPIGGIHLKFIPRDV